MSDGGGFVPFTPDGSLPSTNRTLSELAVAHTHQTSFADLPWLAQALSV